MRFTLILAAIAIVALAARMAIHAPSMAPIQKVAEKSVVVARDKAKDQLAPDNRPADEHPQEGTVVHPTGPTGPVNPTTPEAESPVHPADSTPAVDHSQCPHPMMCEQGDCQRSYAIIFSTEWCGPCKQLHKLADQLIAKGYRIYYWDADKAPQMAQRFQISAVPTTLFFNHGQLQDRFTGIIPESTFLKYLTPRIKLTP